ncbi:MAG: epoxyqueuosine reductase QueH [Candidatus Omnitrophota bacterium]
MKKNILLHICCGVCSGWAIEKLQNEGYCVTGFFYNPNIQPEEEYDKRLSSARKAAELSAIEFLTGDYAPVKWLERVQGLENEPEGGQRCEACFKLRLEEAWRKTQELRLDYFTTTLTISPHKNFELISRIGKTLSPKGFLAYNFKKEDGFRKTQNFSREHGLYRQSYCGCVFSRQQNIAR